MSWLGNCTRCSQPTLSTKDPRYRDSDYIQDEFGYGVRHVWCPTPTGWVQSEPTPYPEPGTEDWYWEQHRFTWSRSCGKEDCDESCYDEGGHGLAADAARNAGFSVRSLRGDPEYREWLLREYGPDPVRPATPLPGKVSPIEDKFWVACQRLGSPVLSGLVFQHPVGRYKIDFALPRRKIGIELDGFRNHSSTEDIEKDRYRQRFLEGHGWYIIRFGGREVTRDPDYCAQQAAWLAENARKGEHG